jgi:HSP20 family protein
LQHQVGGQLIPIDLTEDDKSFKVHAQIPGMKKEDIHVSIDGNQVSIRAETKQEKEEKKGDKVVLRECYYGSQYRSFTLPQAVDSGKTTAKYADGVLELIMPKSGPATGNKIAIN